MKKLGSVEKVEDFFLAVAGGADVNGTFFYQIDAE